MHWLETATRLLTTWSPWVGAAVFLTHAYMKLRSRVTMWADTLLNNHLHHLQMSLENIETLMQKLVDKQ